MRTNCTMAQLTPIKFGYGFVANQKSLKLRFTAERALALYNRLPAHFANQLSVYINMAQQHVIIAYVGHHTSYVWPALEQAVRLSEADVLRARAKRIEGNNGEPPFELPF